MYIVWTFNVAVRTLLLNIIIYYTQNLRFYKHSTYICIWNKKDKLQNCFSIYSLSFKVPYNLLSIHIKSLSKYLLTHIEYLLQIMKYMYKFFVNIFMLFILHIQNGLFFFKIAAFRINWSFTRYHKTLCRMLQLSRLQ